MKGWTDKYVHELKEETEDNLQKCCVRLFAFKYPRLWQQKKLHHIPNGGSRNAIEAAKMKQMGVVPGVCDLMLTVPRNGYAGAFFELKTSKGKLSEHQSDFIESHKEDYYCVIIRSVDEFEKELKKYL